MPLDQSSATAVPACCSPTATLARLRPRRRPARSWPTRPPPTPCRRPWSALSDERGSRHRLEDRRHQCGLAQTAGRVRTLRRPPLRPHDHAVAGEAPLQCRFPARPRAEVVRPFARELPASGAPYTADAVRAATRALLPAFEVIGTPLRRVDRRRHHRPDRRQRRPRRLGPRRPGRRLAAARHPRSPDHARHRRRDPRRPQGRQRRGRGVRRHRLARQCPRRPRIALKAGDYITTGSAIAPFPAAGGQSLVGDFGPLGRVELRVGKDPAKLVQPRAASTWPRRPW